VRADQAAGLVGSQVPGHLRADVVLEAADSRTGERTKDAVHVPFVVTHRGAGLRRIRLPIHPKHLFRGWLPVSL
jgi:hypothetical protein